MADAANTPDWKWSPQQILTTWEAVGGTREHGLLMTAIAVSQSGGWATAENVAGRSTHDLNYRPVYTSYSPTKDYSIGWWQLNFYKSLGPPRAKEWSALGPWPYGNSPTQFAQWIRTEPEAQAEIARHLYNGGKGLSNWTGDPAYEAWLKGGDKALEPWIGQALIDGKGGKGKPPKPPKPKPKPKPPTGGGGGGRQTAPKQIAAPWRQLLQHLNSDGNHANDAAKSLAARLVRAVGG